MAAMDMSNYDAMLVVGPGLSSAGLDLSNDTMASGFLTAILDDTLLQPDDWAASEAFWYGTIIVIAISAVTKLSRWLTLETRIRVAAAKRPRPAQASSRIASALAAVTTVVREVS
ncbi:hypothetical protein MMC30_000185 [Trapelia coarctata]|nr:hypothetical protein [Trapelia coarctata]